MYQTKEEQLEFGTQCLKKQIEDIELLMWELESEYSLTEYDNEERSC